MENEKKFIMSITIVNKRISGQAIAVQKWFKVKPNLAFTLAEVLIVLGIVGIIAQMTIPTLMNSVQTQIYRVAYKKAYADANNAFNSAIGKGDSYVAYSDLSDLYPLPLNWSIFTSQFKLVKECTNNDNDKCWNMSGEQSMGCPTQSEYGFIDVGGRSWTTYNRGLGGYVTDFLVDTNGFKTPNKFGKDRWIFHFVLDNSSSGLPIKILPSIYSDPIDYDENTTEAYECPSGSCYYKSWLLN